MADTRVDRQTLTTARRVRRAFIDPAAARGAVEGVRARLGHVAGAGSAGRDAGVPPVRAAHTCTEAPDPQCTASHVVRQGGTPGSPLRFDAAQAAPARPRGARLARLTAAAAAAVIVAATVVLTIVTPNSSASAARAFRESVETTRAYNGWVHVRSVPASDTGDGPATRPATRPAGPVAAHLNTVDGTSVFEWAPSAAADGGGRRRIEMKVPARRLWYQYDPASGELRISRTGPVLSDAFADAVAGVPITLDELARRFGDGGTTGPSPMSATAEGELTRYDIAPRAATRGFGGSVWVDRATKLIRKVSWDTPGGPSELEYAYGGPGMADVYAAGVPRDAKVVDGRPPDDVGRIVDGLHRRAVAGYGDCVALLTQSVVFPWHSDQPDKGHGELTLYARQGDKAVAARYFTWDMPGPNRGIARWPAGFPQPTLDDALEAIGGGIPAELHVVNGSDSWAGAVGREVDRFHWEGRQGVAAQNVYLYGVGALVWPPRENTGLDVPGTTVAVLTDPARPGLLGLRCAEPRASAGAAGPQLPARRHVFWIDPARDDMPVETIVAEDPPAGGAPRDVVRTRYVEHARLPDGRWYPARWERERLRDGKPEERGQVAVFRLQLFPDRRLNPAWFGGPGHHVVDGASPATRP